MRKLSRILFVATILGAIGCSSKHGPAEPANLSPEQLEAANQEQKKATDSERVNHKTDSSYKKGSIDASIDDEARRAKR